ncbi:MAG: hypothetical protein ACMZI0_15085 [Symbiopectobacterium sp.]|uniref:hypothetical protein n=1 Tax=Symbiopectobacterium sp. TaxID=2952789 RepID=UPI0039EAB967
MDIIKLNQACRIQAAGGENRIEFEPIYIQVSHIESFYSAGRTVLKMTSGDRIEVEQTLEETVALILGSNSETKMSYTPALNAVEVVGLLVVMSAYLTDKRG